jgi:hypothetical protein
LAPKLEVLRPYVEKVVAEFLQLPQDKKLVVDDDGTIPIRAGSATYSVRLIDADPVMLQVFSVLLEKIPKSEQLLETVNDINVNTFSAKVFWLKDERVCAAVELVAETADKEEIAQACNAIAYVADRYDTELHAAFGGEMHSKDEPAPGSDPAEAPADV